ncbi:MAG: hypothetical protein P1Q69_06220, partial [Candidatus Thorarchaeota archaeon]|nr:hypothetical protein [Candidatus Thorarchaeota archaeon]
MSEKLQELEKIRDEVKENPSNVPLEKRKYFWKLVRQIKKEPHPDASEIEIAAEVRDILFEVDRGRTFGTIPSMLLMTLMGIGPLLAYFWLLGTPMDWTNILAWSLLDVWNLILRFIAVLAVVAFFYPWGRMIAGKALGIRIMGMCQDHLHEPTLRIDYVTFLKARPSTRKWFFFFAGLWTAITSLLVGIVGFVYAGARLRDLAMTLYPFPQPQAFHVREYSDGSKKILTKNEADNTPDDGAKKTYWRYGYIEKGMETPVFLSHPTLPGMDFVDMIRVHCVELCRQCFIYHVPMLEAHRYIRLLIHRLRPFLDWVYTDGNEGRRSFNPDADYELRNIVLEIRSLYRKRSRIRQRASQRYGEVATSVSLEGIRGKAIDHLEKSTDMKEREFLLRLLDYLDTALITEKDEIKDHVEKIREDILDQLRRTSDKVSQDALQKILALTTIDSLDFQDQKTPFEQIRERIMTHIAKTTDPTQRVIFLDLLDSLDLKMGYVVYRDIEKLIDQIQALSQRQGNEWHRILFSDLHHPVSLRQVVFSGDKLLDSLSSILVVAELPIARHSGKIDLTIFVRRDVEGRILWTPVMILEVKTKTAFDFNLYGFQLKRKKERTVTPVFYAWKRTLDDEEWG